MDFTDLDENIEYEDFTLRKRLTTQLIEENFPEQGETPEIIDKLTCLLLEHVENNEASALFQLGQVEYEMEDFSSAFQHFKRAVDEEDDLRAKFQLSIILYDGLTAKENHEYAFQLMHEVATSKGEVEGIELRFAAAFNVGRAYFQGHGVRRSEEKMLEWWIKAADDGNPKASVMAQTFLGYFYSGPDYLDLDKAFFWHTQACGNGSLDSQGAIGVMYLYGVGRPKDWTAAFECLRCASDRGNVYAQAHLVYYYYKRCLYTKCAELAAKVSQLDDANEIGMTTRCLVGYINKGISLASFIFARCLDKGLGVQQDPDKAQLYYKKCFKCDPDMCAKLQGAANKGEL